MRLSASIFLLCGLGAAIWAEASGRNAEVEARWPGRVAPPDIQAGIRAHLELLGTLEIRDLAIGEETAAGEWSFRARALDPAAPTDPALPLYGAAATDCDADRQRAACWRLSVLEIDGAPRAEIRR